MPIVLKNICHDLINKNAKYYSGLLAITMVCYYGTNDYKLIMYLSQIIDTVPTTKKIIYLVDLPSYEWLMNYLHMNG